VSGGDLPVLGRLSCVNGVIHVPRHVDDVGFAVGAKFNSNVLKCARHIVFSYFVGDRLNGDHVARLLVVVPHRISVTHF
jgi:hypothetical protein